MARLLREPTLHFFVLGAALLAGHRFVTGDPRTIVITPAIRADLLRRYEDQLNRPPTRAEADAFMNAWKTDEALYREALREGIDRDDPTVRNVLIGKMRERVTLQTRMPEPTEAQLQQYLEEHRADFEAPILYEFEYLALPKGVPDSGEKRSSYVPRLKAGATAASVGLPSTVANVVRERIVQDFGPEVAEQLVHFPPGPWHELETPDRLLLVRMIGTSGGLPPPEVLHAQLVAGFQAAAQQKAAAQAARVITDRYRFEEPSR